MATLPPPRPSGAHRATAGSTDTPPPLLAAALSLLLLAALGAPRAAAAAAAVGDFAGFSRFRAPNFAAAGPPSPAAVPELEAVAPPLEAAAPAHEAAAPAPALSFEEAQAADSIFAQLSVPRRPLGPQMLSLAPQARELQGTGAPAPTVSFFSDASCTTRLGDWGTTAFTDVCGSYTLTSCSAAGVTVLTGGYSNPAGVSYDACAPGNTVMSETFFNASCTLWQSDPSAIYSKVTNSTCTSGGSPHYSGPPPPPLGANAPKCPEGQPIVGVKIRSYIQPGCAGYGQSFGSNSGLYLGVCVMIRPGQAYMLLRAVTMQLATVEYYTGAGCAGGSLYATFTLAFGQCGPTFTFLSAQFRANGGAGSPLWAVDSVMCGSIPAPLYSYTVFNSNYNPAATFTCLSSNVETVGIVSDRCGPLMNSDAFGKSQPVFGRLTTDNPPALAVFLDVNCSTPAVASSSLQNGTAGGCNAVARLLTPSTMVEGSSAIQLTLLAGAKSATCIANGVYTYGGSVCANCSAGASLGPTGAACVPSPTLTAGPIDTAFYLSGAQSEGVSAFPTIAMPSGMTFSMNVFSAPDGALGLATGSYLSAPGSSAPGFLPSGGVLPWSASAWIKCAAPPAPSSFMAVLEWGAAGDAQGILTTQALALVVAGPGYAPPAGSGAVAMPACDNKWHHAALTYDAAKLSVFMDGALATSVNVKIELPPAGASTLRIGWSGNLSINAGSLFTGALSELRIYARSLAASEVVALSQPPLAAFPDAVVTSPTFPMAGTSRYYFSCASGAVGSDGTYNSASLFLNTNDRSWIWSAGVPITCAKCPPGTYKRDYVCAPCAAGSFAASSGTISCTPCPTGVTTTGQATGSTSLSACTTCAPGYYGPITSSGTAGAACAAPCPTGSYTTNSQAGSTSVADCTICAPGWAGAVTSPGKIDNTTQFAVGCTPCFGPSKTFSAAGAASCSTPAPPIVSYYSDAACTQRLSYSDISAFTDVCGSQYTLSLCSNNSVTVMYSNSGTNCAAFLTSISETTYTRACTVVPYRSPPQYAMMMTSPCSSGGSVPPTNFNNYAQNVGGGVLYYGPAPASTSYTPYLGPTTPPLGASLPRCPANQAAVGVQLWRYSDSKCASYGATALGTNSPLYLKVCTPIVLIPPSSVGAFVQLQSLTANTAQVAYYMSSPSGACSGLPIVTLAISIGQCRPALVTQTTLDQTMVGSSFDSNASYVVLAIKCGAIPSPLYSYGTFPASVDPSTGTLAPNCEKWGTSSMGVVSTSCGPLLNGNSFGSSLPAFGRLTIAGGLAVFLDDPNCTSAPAVTYPLNKGLTACNIALHPTTMVGYSYESFQLTQLCPNGTALPSSGGSECSICDSGFYGSPISGSCTPCPAGTSTPSPGSVAASACTVCAPGYSGAPSSPGLHSAGCSVCALGSYAASKNATVCTACPLGTTSYVAGGSGLSACAACAVGYYGVWNAPFAATCTPCPAGSTTTMIGGLNAEACSVCTAGYAYVAKVGCVSCAAGSFAASGTMGSCTPCPPGTTTSSAESTAASACSMCAPGYWGLPQSPGSSAAGCAACASNTYSFGGRSGCATCAPGIGATSGSVFTSSASSCTPSSSFTSGPTDTTFFLSGAQAEGVSAFPTIAGSPAFTASAFSAASGALLLSNGSYLSVPGLSLPSGLPTGSSAWSASAWVKCAAPAAPGAYSAALEWGAAGDAGQGTVGAASDAAALRAMSLLVAAPNAASTGGVSTLAGFAAVGFGSFADGTGSSARFWRPSSVAFVPSTGELVVADTGNHRIRLVSSSGVTTTIAGGGNSSTSFSCYYSASCGFADGAGPAASFNSPQGIAVNPSTGLIAVADTLNNRIRIVTTSGLVTTLAGSCAAIVQPGRQGCVGTLADGEGASVGFNGPSALAFVPSSGVLVVADTWNHRIRAITSSGFVTTLAGGGGVCQGGGSICGAFSDGQGAVAAFNQPTGIAFFAAANVFVVADSNNGRVRRVTLDGIVTTLAGGAQYSSAADGIGAGAYFGYPFGVAVVPSSGAVVVADMVARIRLVTNPGGVVTTIAGYSGVEGFADGAFAAAKFSQATGVAVHPATGAIAVADANNNRVRLISQGVVFGVCDASWHHVALTFSPLSTPPSVAAFVDGLLLSQPAPLLAAPQLPNSAAAATLRIGWSGDLTANGGSLFTGSLSELRIYNRTVTAGEAAALARGPPTATATATASASATATSSPTTSATSTSTASRTATASATATVSSSATSSSSATASATVSSSASPTVSSVWSCPPGSISPPGAPPPAPGRMICAFCAPGTWAATGDLACALCPQGTFGNRAGLASAACSGTCAVAAECLPGTVYPPSGALGSAPVGTGSGGSLTCSAADSRAVPTSLGLQVWPAAAPGNFRGLDLLVAPLTTCQQLVGGAAAASPTCGGAASVVGADGATRFVVGTLAQFNMQPAETMRCTSSG